ncbi:hypothetical protein HYS48_01010 [Candidatus Woesearchaeota archaeon]|nr:hypothetical protein [Candidatus Woesearchaeota archaeon]
MPTKAIFTTQPISVLDAVGTLVHIPAWEGLKQTDPKVKKAWEGYQQDPSKRREYAALLETYILEEKVQAVAFPDVKPALETLLSRGQLGVFSNHAYGPLGVMLAQAELRDFFCNEQIVSTVDHFHGISKRDPKAFRFLDCFFRDMGFRMQAYTDDIEAVAQAAAEAVRSGVPYPFAVYHLVRGSGLQAPKQQSGYIRIASLHDMLTLQEGTA